jgi:hypothetical protein
VLDEVAFWDLFYEHCSYFTAETLTYAFERAGFDVLSIRRVYDGQYLVLEARPRIADTAESRRASGESVQSILALAERFVDRYRSITAVCRANLERIVQDERTVALWGGGAKAVSFLTSLEVGNLVAFAVDVNPNKQGKFLVGTGHPVVGPGQLCNYSSLQLVVMNPVYVPEITRSVEALGVDAQIISVNDLLGAAPALG